MMNGADHFERSIRASLEGFEVPYNSADWNQMDQALDGLRPTSWWASPILYAAALAGAIALGGSTYLLVRDHSIEGKGTTAIADAAKNDLEHKTNTGATQTAPGGDDAALISDPAANTGQIALTESAHTSTGNALRTMGASTAAPVGASTTGKDRVPPGSGDQEAPVGTTGTAADDHGAFRASVSRGCEGTAVEFSVNNMPENGLYLWNFGDGNFSNKPNPNHTYNKAGKFTVTLSLSGTGVGTIRNEPYADLIVIDEVPTALFTSVYRDYQGHVPSVHFENRSHGATRFHWDFGDGSTSTVAHPDHVYREKGTYKVTLRVFNDSGCEDMIENDVAIASDYNLLAPAAFSPNGDGDDDFFMPQALKELGVKFQLSIYEPNAGKLVYQTSDATKPWTGRFMNTGAACSPGQYVWMVEVKEDIHIGEITYEGKVSLVN